MEIKKILVPIDGSDPSERAFQEACFLAEKTEAKIIMLYVMDPEALMPAYKELPKHPEDPFIKKGEAILDVYLQDAPKDVETEKKVVFGVPGTSIVREAEDKDLIVMGNSGKGSISSFVMGSVSHYVVHHSECPVLIVK